jgi:uncharacterized membrane protein YkoI
MRLIHRTVLLLSAGIVLAIPAASTEKKIKRADLPSEVQKTVDVEAKGATIRGFSQETEHGNTYYEVELISSGHHKDVLIDSRGAVTEIEEEVPMASLPAEVRAGLENRAAGGAVKKVESLTKNGKLVAYEAQVLTHGKKSEIQVGPDGKALPHPE